MSDIKQETINRYLSTITTSALSKFAQEAVTKYSTEEKLQEANKVISVLKALYTKKGVIRPNCDPYFIELMETAAFVHNLFYDGTWISCFIAREKLTDLAKQYDIKGEHIDHIFTIVEGQLGIGMPVVSARPNPNTPVEDFALCCWIVKELSYE